MSKDWCTWYGVPSSNKVQCKACNSVFAKKTCRMLSHLGYEGTAGIRDTGVSLCPQLSSQIRALFVRCKGKFPQRPAVCHVDGIDVALIDNDISNGRATQRSTQEDSCTAPEEVVRGTSEGNQNTGTSGERETPRASSSRLQRQSTLVDGFEEATRRKLNEVWANFFYAANIPFAVARNPAFKEAVKRTAEYNKAYNPPSYHDLRHKLLDQAKTDIEAKMKKRTEDSIRKFGATLSIDGWSSVTNRPLINAMLVSSAGEQFLGAVDTSGEEKNAVYLASILETFIEKVGPANVVQVTTDNAPVNPAAWNLVSSKYPHIFFQGCAVHALNLLIKDWGSQKWVEDEVTKGRIVVKFFKKRHLPLAIFWKYETKYSLLMPGETRFASNYLMIARLIKVKEKLQQTVTDPQWGEHVRKLGRNSSSRKEFRAVRETILDDQFWLRCVNIKDVLAPVVHGLRDLNAKTPCMGKVLHITRKLEEHVLTLSEKPFYLSSHLAIPLVKSFYERRKMVETDLHYAGALLNPYLLQDKELADDQYATDACKRVLMKICKPRDYANVVKEFVAFRHREPPFHNMLDPKEQKMSAHAWWDFEGACGKLIAPIAKRILAQPVSSSSCERNWSSYSFVHNKFRNKLKAQRAMDLVYVYTNSKVLSTSKERDEKKWYHENVESEDSEEPSSEDEDGEPVLDDREAMSNDLENVDDETFRSLNRNNEGFGINRLGVFDYQSDEDNCAYDEDVTPISRFLDGTGALTSKNIIAEKEDTRVQLADENGTMDVNDATLQTDEVIAFLNSPSTSLAQAEEHEKPHEVEKNVDSRLLGSKRPRLVSNGVGTKELVQDLQVPTHGGPPRALFTTVSTTLDGVEGSQFGKQHLNVFKDMLPCINQTRSILALSDDEKDETLAQICDCHFEHLP